MLTRSIMKHSDYMAVISFDPSADAFHGRVVGITDVVNFYGRSPKELRREFKASIDEYGLKTRVRQAHLYQAGVGKARRSGTNRYVNVQAFHGGIDGLRHGGRRARCSG